jgi:2-pyrone-4,6-dicarboxylate lactonase
VPPGASTRIATSSARRRVPLRAGAQVHALRRLEGTSLALRDHLGFARNVVVQATCHGADNRAMVDACRASGGKARGVATVRRRSPTPSCRRMHAAGVRGVRFNFVKRLVDFTPKDELMEIAGAHRHAGLARGDLLRGGGPARTVGFLHDAAHHRGGRPHGPARRDEAGGRPRVRAVPQVHARHPERLEQGQLPGAACLSGRRRSGPPSYDDVVPFAKRIVEDFPGRVLWGTDWPHPNLKGHMPDDGRLVDFIPRIATTAERQRKLLVDNPMRLYWPEEN